MLIFILFFAFGIAHCPEPRDNLIQCFRDLIDLNKDSTITIAELDHFLANQNCINKKITSHITGTHIMNTCDFNHDGILTLSDWTATNACVSTPHRIEMVCVLCERCGWEGKKRKESEHSL
jgi:hypothetical protein